MQNTQNHRLRHRHFVVLPVFLTLALAGFADVSGGLGQAATALSSVFADDTAERFSLPSGAYGVVDGGALTEENGVLHLSAGSALVASRGSIRLASNGTDLAAFDGAFHVSHGTRGMTVAALTSPVAVSAGDSRMVVPVGMQWTFDAEDGVAALSEGFDAWMASRTPRQVPPSFVERAMADLSLVRVPDAPLPEGQSSLPEERVAEALLLPASAEKATEERHARSLGAFRSAVEDGDEARAAAMLQSDVLRAAFATDNGTNVLAFLLSGLPEGTTGMRMLLLTEAALDPFFWMVASFHPEYRDVAWTVPAPKVSAETELTRAFLFPFGAFTADDFSDFLFMRYEASVLAMLERTDDPEIFLEHIVEAHQPLIERLVEQGYPKRASELTRTLLSLIDASQVDSASLAAAAKKLRQREPVDLSPLPPKAEPVAEAPVSDVPAEVPAPPVVLSPRDVEARAEYMLSDAGALFTIHTTVTATEENRVRVSGAVFGSSKGDHTASFTLDVLAGTVHEIEIDGATGFPYTPSFEGFITWITK